MGVGVVTDTELVDDLATDLRAGRTWGDAEGAAAARCGGDLDRVRRLIPQVNDRVLPHTNGKRDTAGRGVVLEDFYAHMPSHSYIFGPTGEMWPAASVNARIPSVQDGEKPIPAATWLDKHRAVEQVTWAPGMSKVIEDRLISDGGWITRRGCRTFNLYRAPQTTAGDASQAIRWVEHVHRVYPAEASHIIAWLAHRVQRPGEKVNHALVLGGLQGIGKDTILEPVKYAVGAWNFTEISPTNLLGNFNGYVKSVILRISEARDLGDVDRYSFYEHMKVYAAAPPDVIRCNEKHTREYAVLNVTGVVITSNHSDGIYLPSDDRRHYVAWSERTKDDFSTQYWTDLYGWYAAGGVRDVAAYLQQLDLEGFNAKAPPPKTAAFWDVVDLNRAPEDADLADVLDTLGHPSATTLTELASRAEGSFADWLRDRRNNRQIPHRLDAAGYVKVRNDAAADGLWKIGKKRQAVYVRQELSTRDRIAAASALAGGER